MNKRDVVFILIIGALVGLLAQPILANVMRVDLSVAVRVVIFLVFFIGAPTALLICKMLSRFVPIAFEFGKFAAVGVLNTFVDFGVFNALEVFVNANPGSQVFIIFKSLAFVCANLNSYFWNATWTFKEGSSANTGLRQGIEFFLVSVIGIAINIGVAFATRSVGSNVLHLSGAIIDNLAVLMATVSVLFANFVGYKYFVFRKK